MGVMGPWVERIVRVLTSKVSRRRSFDVFGIFGVLGVRFGDKCRKTSKNLCTTHGHFKARARPVLFVRSVEDFE